MYALAAGEGGAGGWLRAAHESLFAASQVLSDEGEGKACKVAAAARAAHDDVGVVADFGELRVSRHATLNTFNPQPPFPRTQTPNPRTQTLKPRTYLFQGFFADDGLVQQHVVEHLCVC